MSKMKQKRFQEHSTTSCYCEKPCYDFDVSMELCELCRGELFHPSAKHMDLSKELNEPHFEWLMPKKKSKTTSNQKS